MAIRVVTSASAVRQGFNLWRAARTILGWVLTLGGLLVAVPSFGLIVAVALMPRNSSGGKLGTVLLYLGVGAAAVLIGRRLIRGRRRLILFLRRFGFKGSSRALSFAVRTAVGRRFRVVTLDDAELAPWGTRRWVRWLLAAASLVSVILLALIVWEFARWITGGALGNFFSGVFENARSAAAGRGENAFGAVVAGLVSAFILSLIVGLITLTLIVIIFAFVGTSAAVSVSSCLGVIKAELAKRATIRRLDELRRVTALITKKARRIFAPRLVVLSSAGSVWRETVKGLAGVADILLIDVSVPSDNLLWEISTLKADHGRRWILIGESERIAEIVKNAGPKAAGAAMRLVDLLDGEEVLTYATGSRKTLRQFAKALRTTCESTSARAVA